MLPGRRGETRSSRLCQRAAIASRSPWSFPIDLDNRGVGRRLGDVTIEGEPRSPARASCTASAGFLYRHLRGRGPVTCAARAAAPHRTCSGTCNGACDADAASRLSGQLLRTCSGTCNRTSTPTAAHCIGTGTSDVTRDLPPRLRSAGDLDPMQRMRRDAEPTASACDAPPTLPRPAPAGCRFVALSRRRGRPARVVALVSNPRATTLPALRPGAHAYALAPSSSRSSLAGAPDLAGLGRAQAAACRHRVEAGSPPRRASPSGIRLVESRPRYGVGLGA